MSRFHLLCAIGCGSLLIASQAVAQQLVWSGRDYRVVYSSPAQQAMVYRAAQQLAVYRASQYAAQVRAAQIRMQQQARINAARYNQRHAAYSRAPGGAGWGQGRNFWSGRAGSGNHNANNTAGYVWIPGTGGVSYGLD